MIRKGIPIYIKPNERLCDMCKHDDVLITDLPCKKCFAVGPLFSSWEIDPERAITITNDRQRIEQLEYMVLQMQKQLKELGFGLAEHELRNHNH